uniref:Uncharacterized protein n=1 Tax=Leersia perrieri TaxID=77586 RepID=A0A0D9XRD3_9ORYZ
MTTTGDEIGSSPPAVAPNEDYESWTFQQKLDDLLNSDPNRNIMPKYPKHAAMMKEKLRLHLEGLDMFKEGKNGRPLKKLRDKKKALLTILSWWYPMKRLLNMFHQF